MVKKRKKTSYLTCPECGSNNIHVYEQTAYKLLANDDYEYYCQTSKLHDKDARVECQEHLCEWTGIRGELVKVE